MLFDLVRRGQRCAKHPVMHRTVPHLHTHTHTPQKLSSPNVSGEEVEKFCYITKSYVFMGTCQIYGKVGHPHFMKLSECADRQDI